MLKPKSSTSSIPHLFLRLFLADLLLILPRLLLFIKFDKFPLINFRQPLPEFIDLRSHGDERVEEDIAFFLVREVTVLKGLLL